MFAEGTEQAARLLPICQFRTLAQQCLFRRCENFPADAPAEKLGYSHPYGAVASRTFCNAPSRGGPTFVEKVSIPTAWRTSATRISLRLLQHPVSGSVEKPFPPEKSRKFFTELERDYVEQTRLIISDNTQTCDQSQPFVPRNGNISSEGPEQKTYGERVSSTWRRSSAR